MAGGGAVPGGKGGGGGGGQSALGDDQLKMLLKKINQDTSQKDSAYQQALKTTDTMGAGLQRQNQELTGQQQATAQQSLLSRGLGNSTIVDSVHQGIARQGQNASADIADRVAQQRINVLLSKNNLPETSLYSQLVMQQAQLRQQMQLQQMSQSSASNSGGNIQQNNLLHNYNFPGY